MSESNSNSLAFWCHVVDITFLTSDLTWMSLHFGLGDVNLPHYDTCGITTGNTTGFSEPEHEKRDVTK